MRLGTITDAVETLGLADAGEAWDLVSSGRLRAELEDDGLWIIYDDEEP